jgi:PTH1 family peptidyl-tRNA hydrolase
MVWQRVVLGIGNPGPEYADTRHNVGFMVLDRVAGRLGLTFARLERRDAGGEKRFSGKVKAHVAEGRRAGRAFVLVKPQTYVNLSGDVAGPLLRLAGLGPESLFVVLDDLNLPLGRLRCRPAGSSGGHNGLASIEQSLGSQGYPRLRLGIGAPSGPMVDHVLERFLPEEQEVLGPALDRAAEATVDWLGGANMEVLMSRYNNNPGSGSGSGS